jgi:N-acetyl-gamma-glutamyl-phosphate reductase
MARARVFVDGHVGTTGLRIRDWLAGREEIAVVSLDEERRKDPEARRAALADADVAVLCLPDDAAREAVAWAGEGSTTRVLDTSTAHRTSEGWAYGLPEISPEQRRSIAAARRVANPGCYPSTVILALRPLIQEGLLPAGAPITVHALSGYSGGGRALIERWEDPANGLVGLPYEAPYALDRRHKHVPEMVRYSGLRRPPQFVPAVGPFACGMRVEIPLHADLLTRGATAKRIAEVLVERYRDERFVSVVPFADPFAVDDHRFDPRRCNDTNRLELAVLPHPDGHVLLVGLLDNLGKGAAGAAIQNLNLMLGFEEGAGLPG